MEKPRGDSPPFTWAPFILVTLYIILTLSVDTLTVTRSRAFNIDWPNLFGIHWPRWFSWQFNSGFDAFKFLFWLAIPAAFTWRRLHLHHLTPRPWKRIDYALLAAFWTLAALSILLIPHLPGIGAFYQNHTHSDWRAFSYYLIWTTSWLPGWEFMFRCCLPAFLNWRRQSGAWLVIPLLEGIYHLQKTPLEAALMTLFSLLLTPWAIARRNLLLPFLAHLSFEIGLAIYLYIL